MKHRMARKIALATALALCGFGSVRADFAETADQAERRMNAQQITDTVPPPTYVWTGPIPAAYVGLACPQHEADVIALRFLRAGASRSTVEWALYTISRESGCRHWLRNHNLSTGDDSFGLCQLNALAGHFGPNGVLAGWDRWRLLEDFSYNVDACVKMWTVCGRGPWNRDGYYCTRPTA